MAAEANGRPQRSLPGTVTVASAAPNCARVALRGEWDISTEPQLSEALRRAGRTQHVVVDLGECTFLDSRTVGSLMRSAQENGEHGGRLVIALPACQAAVNRAFDVLGIRELLPVYRTIEQALQSLEIPPASSARRWLNPSPPTPVD